MHGERGRGEQLEKPRRSDLIVTCGQAVQARHEQRRRAALLAAWIGGDQPRCRDGPPFDQGQGGHLSRDGEVRIPIPPVEARSATQDDSPPVAPVQRDGDMGVRSATGEDHGSQDPRSPGVLGHPGECSRGERRVQGHGFLERGDPPWSMGAPAPFSGCSMHGSHPTHPPSCGRFENRRLMDAFGSIPAVAESGEGTGGERPGPISAPRSVAPACGLPPPAVRSRARRRRRAQPRRAGPRSS